MAAVSETELRNWGYILNNPETPLVERFRALWGLKHAKEDLSVDMIAQAFSSKSELLKHELAYCLGQKANPKAIEVLENVLQDNNQEPIVRHEAGEALAAIGDKNSYDILNQYSKYENKEVAETCYIGCKRLDFFRNINPDSLPPNNFDTIDPAPEFPENEKTLAELEFIMVSETADLFDKYRALFSLRRIANSPHDQSQSALDIMSHCLLLSDNSALFRHEIAFVFGQLANPATIKALCASVANRSELGMVRHESAEALGAIGNEECQQFLTRYLEDSEQVVMESCVVALDMAEYNSCENFAQYAFVPEQLRV